MEGYTKDDATENWKDPGSPDDTVVFLLNYLSVNFMLHERKQAFILLKLHFFGASVSS